MGVIGTLRKFLAVNVWGVGEYVATPVTLSDGDMAPAQVDVNGNLKVAVVSGSSSAEYLSSPPTLTNGQTSPLLLDSSGNLKVVQQGSVAVSSVGGTVTVAGTVTQGTAAATAGAWPVKNTDGTNVAAVKAASTAAAFTDPALAVALRPGDMFPAAAAGADASSNATTTTAVSARNAGYNGTSWDRIRAGLSGVQTTLTGIQNTIGMAQYNTSPPTAANGNVVPLQADVSGNLKSAEYGGGAYPVAAAAADATANPTITKVGAYSLSFNGTTWDRLRAGVTGVLTSVLGFANVINVAQFNLTKPTLADTNFTGLQIDGNGNLRIAEQFAPGGEDNANAVIAMMTKPLPSATYCASTYTNLGAAVTQNVKASPGNLFAFTCQNLNVALRYIQFHDTATTPSAGAVPKKSFPVPASGFFALDRAMFSDAGLRFATGIAMAFSTTATTYTAGSAADQITQAEFI